MNLEVTLEFGKRNQYMYRFKLYNIMPANNPISKTELRELVLSWQILDAVSLALEDKRALFLILELAGEDDETTRLRAFVALGEILKRADNDLRMMVLERHLDVFINALSQENEKVTIKALRALGYLVKGVPMGSKTFLKAAKTLVSLLESPDDMMRIETIDVLSKLQPLEDSKLVRTYINELVVSPDLYTKVAGFCLFLNMLNSSADSGPLTLILDEIPSLLQNDNEFIVELALDVLEKALSFPLLEDVKIELLKISRIVNGLVYWEGAPIIRLKAKRVSDLIDSVIST
ncbi:HEAT repeat domain-containing protein [Thermococcus sp. GR6]|uniref:HEAT repeat domain-containing protein n=1 Tax=Thermococcus sp. GR6 TaxID=1638256 RepID=UPI0014313C1F|nr:HEAT repeat domain-containing protein [Thermococcus sp. GR6]NJE42826.1 hypothetical protein [Thermococcus sp. GR6]